jgi:hypothetical protein
MFFPCSRSHHTRNNHFEWVFRKDNLLCYPQTAISDSD